MISELNQLARIASLECRLVIIPCLPEVFVSNVGAARMNFIAHLSGGRLGSFCFLFSSVFLAVTLVQKNPPVRSADSPFAGSSRTFAHLLCDGRRPLSAQYHA
jgi:hypothetical protein